VLFFLPGHYLIDTLFPKDFTTLRGERAVGYQEPGDTILSPVKPTTARLIDMNSRRSVRLEGLTLHRVDLGDDTMLYMRSLASIVTISRNAL